MVLLLRNPVPVARAAPDPMWLYALNAELSAPRTLLPRLVPDFRLTPLGFTLFILILFCFGYCYCS